MSKERLEEIPYNVGYSLNDNENVLIKEDDYKWLYEQAERVQELEKKNDRLKQEADFWRVEDREMMRLSHENKRYREALEEIAQKRMTYADMAGALQIANKALEESV